MSVHEAAASHLRALAAEPRPAGSSAAAAARRYCQEVLGALGFQVRERPFAYSAFVGELGTPLGGALALGGVVLAALAGERGHDVAALAVLVATLLLLVGGGRWLARRGVLALPIRRREGVNLEAVRAAGEPRLWLLAHIDSKSQPVPLLARAAGIVVLGAAWLAALLLAASRLAGGRDSAGPAWRWVVAGAVTGALPVLFSVVGRRSPGAIDDASGVATVLAAASLLPPQTPVGVLITDAEELGLAGSRAWCADRGKAGTALNCDGVDDLGRLTLMWTRPRSPRLERAVRTAASSVESLRIIPLIPGVLVDGVALADAGWEVLTVSRGSLGTLARIHTARDTVDRLHGGGVAIAARVLAAAAVTLTESA